MPVLVLIGLAGCAADAPPPSPPAEPVPAAATLDPMTGEMRAVLEELEALGWRPPHGLTPEQARRQPTLARRGRVARLDAAGGRP